jgi:GNAT superfamily N-acetyltransferase
MMNQIRDHIEIISINDDVLVREVSLVHLEAFGGYFNSRLGNNYARSLIRWFTHEKQAIAIAAVDESRHVLGYAIGAPIGHGHALQRDLFWVSACSLLLRPWLFCDARLWGIGKSRLKNLVGSREAGQSVHLPQPTMSLVAIGIASAAQRRGIGIQLMRSFVERARTLNMRSLLLWVDEDRTGTRHFYEKCGWRQYTKAMDGSAFYFQLIDQQMSSLQPPSAGDQVVAL